MLLLDLLWLISWSQVNLITCWESLLVVLFCYDSNIYRIFSLLSAKLLCQSVYANFAGHQSFADCFFLTLVFHPSTIFVLYLYFEGNLSRKSLIIPVYVFIRCVPLYLDIIILPIDWVACKIELKRGNWANTLVHKLSICFIHTLISKWAQFEQEKNQSKA